MKKKIMALALAVLMLTVAVVGGTMAYFTDTDEATNVFTVGNVDIKLLETSLHRDNDKATDDMIRESAENYETYLAENGKNMVPGRYVMKAPYVENTGKNAAYVRIILTQSKTMWETATYTAYTTAREEGAIVQDPIPTEPDVNGNYVCVFTYTEPLEPGEITYYCPFWRFKVSNAMDNKDVLAWGEDATEEVIVTVEAIQAEGFKDYKEAFAAFDAQKNNT